MAAFRNGASRFWRRLVSCGLIYLLAGQSIVAGLLGPRDAALAGFEHPLAAFEICAHDPADVPGGSPNRSPTRDHCALCTVGGPPTLLLPDPIALPFRTATVVSETWRQPVWTLPTRNRHLHEPPRGPPALM